MREIRAFSRVLDGGDGVQDARFARRARLSVPDLYRRRGQPVGTENRYLRSTGTKASAGVVGDDLPTQDSSGRCDLRTDHYDTNFVGGSDAVRTGARYVCSLLVDRLVNGTTQARRQSTANGRAGTRSELARAFLHRPAFLTPPDRSNPSPQSYGPSSRARLPKELRLGPAAETYLGSSHASAVLCRLCGFAHGISRGRGRRLVRSTQQQPNGTPQLLRSQDLKANRGKTGAVWPRICVAQGDIGAILRPARAEAVTRLRLRGWAGRQ